MKKNNSLSGRVLITGAAGFTGKYLSSYLPEKYPEAEVWGIDISEQPISLSSINFVKSDITDYDNIKRAIVRIQPDIIFHLAGTFDYGNLMSLYRVNVIGTEYLLRATAYLSKKIRIILASSASVYGTVLPEENPVKEENKLNPVSHYGISKLVMEKIGTMYGQRENNLEVIIARTFNLIGYGLSPILLPGKLAKEIQELSKSQERKTLKVGNTNTIRDFIDVRDAVKALALLAIHAKENNAYNIGSGVGNKIKDLINLFIDNVDPNIEILTDQNLFKDSDPDIVLADISKIKNHTGWKPEIRLDKSVLDIIKHFKQTGVS